MYQTRTVWIWVWVWLLYKKLLVVFPFELDKNVKFGLILSIILFFLDNESIDSQEKIFFSTSQCDLTTRELLRNIAFLLNPSINLTKTTWIIIIIHIDLSLLIFILLKRLVHGKHSIYQRQTIFYSNELFLSSS
jgi:hypothetical protein